MEKYKKKITRMERILDDVDSTEKAPYPIHFEIEWNWFRRLQVRIRKKFIMKIAVCDRLFHFDTISCSWNGLFLV